MLTVSEVACLAGVTVRALHHYDKIGLLRPHRRSPSGYRLYTGEDLQRLQQIVFWQELNVGLADIASMLDDPDFDRLEALSVQKSVLENRIRHLQAIATTVDAAIAEERGVKPMPSSEMFPTFDPLEYVDEVKAKWGKTSMYRQITTKPKTRGQDETASWVAQEESFIARLAATKEGGAASDSPDATALAEEARLAITNQFYECSHDMHNALGELYVTDDRFKEHYNARAVGLAEWYRDAIAANAHRNEAPSDTTSDS